MTMQMEGAKVLANGRKLVLDMKRNRAVCCMTDFTAAACKDARRPFQDSLPGTFYTDIKSKMNSDGCKNNFKPEANKSLLRNYSNFMKSGLPERVYIYENGVWMDFSTCFVGLLKEDFRMKKMSVQVEFRGIPSLFDFLRMILVDLKKGLQRPVAWIDEFGTCFFPDPCSIIDDLHQCIQSSGRENHSLLYPETSDNHEIELQMETAVTTEGNLEIGECDEGSSSCVMPLNNEGEPNSVNTDILDQEDSTNEKLHFEMREIICENWPSDSLPPNDRKLGSLNDKVFSDVVKHMFLKGMDSLVSTVKVHRIQHYPVSLLRTQLELFKKQIATTAKYRGNANVKYAWLSSSKEAVSRILIDGLGFNELSESRPSYGGIQLASISCSHVSASQCDVDENGIQYVILCRVILGNVELVQAGSEQASPSCEKFDSGVDDLINAEKYTIWNTNARTHIYPEYVVCFERSPSGKGHSSERGSKNMMFAGRASEGGSKDMVFAVKNSTACQDKLQRKSYSAISAGHCRRTPNTLKMPQGKYPTIKFAGRPPKSLWMSFPELFAALEDKVPYRRMKLLYHFYDHFLNNKVSREQLVRRVRHAVGDTLLKSTIISLNAKQQGFHELNVAKEHLTS